MVGAKESGIGGPSLQTDKGGTKRKYKVAASRGTPPKRKKTARTKDATEEAHASKDVTEKAQASKGAAEKAKGSKDAPKNPNARKEGPQHPETSKAAGKRPMKELKETDAIRNRASPYRLYTVNEGLTLNQRIALMDAKLGGLLNVASSMPVDLSQWVMRCYDPVKSELVIPDRGRIPIDSESVHEMWDLPKSGFKVCWDHDTEVVAAVNEQYGFGGSNAPDLTAWCTMIKEMNGRSDAAFVQAWSMIAFSCFLAPTTSVKVCTRSYLVSSSPNILPKTNIAQFVVDQIRGAFMSLGKKKSVCCCVYHLVLKYLDSLEVDVMISDCTPRVNAWPPDLITKVMKKDRLSPGVFGKLQLKEKYRDIAPAHLFGGLLKAEQFVAANLPASYEHSKKRKISAMVQVFASEFEESLRKFVHGIGRLDDSGSSGTNDQPPPKGKARAKRPATKTRRKEPVEEDSLPEATSSDDDSDGNQSVTVELDDEDSEDDRDRGNDDGLDDEDEHSQDSVNDDDDTDGDNDETEKNDDEEGENQDSEKTQEDEGEKGHEIEGSSKKGTGDKVVEEGDKQASEEEGNKEDAEEKDAEEGEKQGAEEEGNKKDAEDEDGEEGTKKDTGDDDEEHEEGHNKDKDNTGGDGGLGGGRNNGDDDGAAGGGAAGGASTGGSGSGGNRSDQADTSGKGVPPSPPVTYIRKRRKGHGANASEVGDGCDTDIWDISLMDICNMEKPNPLPEIPQFETPIIWDEGPTDMLRNISLSSLGKEMQTDERDEDLLQNLCTPTSYNDWFEKSHGLQPGCQEKVDLWKPKMNKSNANDPGATSVPLEATSHAAGAIYTDRAAITEAISLEATSFTPAANTVTAPATNPAIAAVTNPATSAAPNPATPTATAAAANPTTATAAAAAANPATATAAAAANPATPTATTAAANPATPTATTAAANPTTATAAYPATSAAAYSATVAEATSVTVTATSFTIPATSSTVPATSLAAPAIPLTVAAAPAKTATTSVHSESQTMGKFHPQDARQRYARLSIKLPSSTTASLANTGTQQATISAPQAIPVLPQATMVIPQATSRVSQPAPVATATTSHQFVPSRQTCPPPPPAISKEPDMSQDEVFNIINKLKAPTSWNQNMLRSKSAEAGFKRNVQSFNMLNRRNSASRIGDGFCDAPSFSLGPEFDAVSAPTASTVHIVDEGEYRELEKVCAAAEASYRTREPVSVREEQPVSPSNFHTPSKTPEHPVGDCSAGSTAPQLHARRIIKAAPCMKSPFAGNNKQFSCSVETNKLYALVLLHGRRPSRRQGTDNSPDICNFGKFHATLAELADSMKAGGWLHTSIMEMGIEYLNKTIPAEAKKVIMPLRIGTQMQNMDWSGAEIKDLWSKDKRLDRKDMITIPVIQALNPNAKVVVHHYFVLNINIRDHKFEVLDSWRTIKDKLLKDCIDKIIATASILWDDNYKKSKIQIDTFQIQEINVPKQTTNYDCGVCTLMNAELWEGRFEPNYKATDLPNIRKIMTNNWVTSVENQVDWKAVLKQK